MVLLAWLRRRLVFAVLVVSGLSSNASAQNVPVVAAASDLQFALAEIAERFQRETGSAVRISFGSSGNFRRQIAQGGPFELYLSADEEYVLALHQAGFTEDEGVLYAIGRVVLMVPHGSNLSADGQLGTLAKALERGEIRRFAIANPEHAPYGVAAKESLLHAGLWESLQPYLIYGENVSQAAQFALSGNAEGGIIAYSLALAPNIAARGSFEPIPESWHNPLRQRMVLVKGAGETARRFYDYVQSPPARDILTRYGFVLPGE